MVKRNEKKEKPVEPNLDTTYPKGPGDTSSVVHMIFGAIFGLWVALLFSSRFPNGSVYSILFIVYSLSFIGLLSIILQAGFTRRVRGQRIFAYFLLLLCCLLVIPGISSVSVYAYPTEKYITPAEVWFVAIVIPTWCVTAELGSILVAFFDDK